MNNSIQPESEHGNGFLGKDPRSLVIGRFDDAIDRGEVGKVSFIILQDPGTDFVLTCLLARSEPLVAM